MAVERTEYEVPAGTDDRMEVLGALSARAGCQGWAFVQVDLTGDGFALKLEVGGVIQDKRAVRALLERTLESL